MRVSEMLALVEYLKAMKLLLPEALHANHDKVIANLNKSALRASQGVMTSTTVKVKK